MQEKLEDLFEVIFLGLVCYLCLYPAFWLMMDSMKFSIENFLMLNHF